MTGEATPSEYGDDDYLQPERVSHAWYDEDAYGEQPPSPPPGPPLYRFDQYGEAEPAYDQPPAQAAYGEEPVDMLGASPKRGEVVQPEPEPEPVDPPPAARPAPTAAPRSEAVAESQRRFPATEPPARPQSSAAELQPYDVPRMGELRKPIVPQLRVVGDRRIEATRAYDERLVHEPQVNVLHGDPRKADKVMGDITLSHVEHRLNYETGASASVVTARFAPPPKGTYLEQHAGRGWYQYVKANITDPDSLYAALSPDEAARAAATASADGNPKAASFAAHILISASRNLEQFWAENGEPGRRPSLANLRDAAGALAGAREHECPTLTFGAMQAVRKSLSKDLDSYKQLYPALQTFLSDAVGYGRPEDMDRPQPEVRAHQAHPNGPVAVFDLRVPPTASVTEQKATGALLAAGILTFLAKTAQESQPDDDGASWSPPGLVNLHDLDQAPPALAEAVVDALRRLEVPFTVSVSKITDQIKPLIQYGAHVILKPGLGQERALSEFMGNVGEETVTSSSYSHNTSWGTSDGGSDGGSDGSSLNYKRDGGGDPESGATNRGRNWGRSWGTTDGGSDGYSQTTNPSGPRVKDDEAGALGSDDAVVFGSNRNSPGKYSIEDRTQTDVFPPPRQKPMGVKAKKTAPPPVEPRRDRREELPSRDEQPAIESGRRPDDAKGGSGQSTTQEQGQTDEEAVAGRFRPPPGLSTRPQVQQPSRWQQHYEVDYDIARRAGTAGRDYGEWLRTRFVLEQRAQGVEPGTIRERDFQHFRHYIGYRRRPPRDDQDDEIIG